MSKKCSFCNEKFTKYDRYTEEDDGSRMHPQCWFHSFDYSNYQEWLENR